MQQRLLGSWESGFRSAHDMLHGTMLVVSKAHIVGVYDLKKIQQAFALLFQQHPLLRATVEIKGYNAYFVLNANFANIPIRELNNLENWQDHFELEIHQPLHPEQYLWRISLAKSSKGFDMFIITHHAIADALSIINLLDQFMKCYSELFRNVTPALQTLKFLKNIEYYLKETNDWQKFAKNYLELDQQSIDKIPYENNSVIAERRSRSQFFTLDPILLGHILTKCREKQLTFNSLLNSIMLLTQVKVNPHFTNASLKTPVNLRSYAEPKIALENIGCFLSIVETIHRDVKSEDDVWKLAETFQKQLYNAIPKIGFLPRTTDYAEVDVALLTQLFGVSNAKRRTYLPNTFGVSNIGKVEIQTEYKNFMLEDFVFSTNHLVGNYYMFLSALTLYDELKLIFSYVTPLISENSAAQFIKEFMKIIKKIA